VMKTNVLLDIGPDDPNFEIFKDLGILLKFQKKVVLEIACETIDLSSTTAELTLSEPADYRGLKVWVPMKHIILAYGGVKAKIGFSLFQNSK